MKSAKPKTPKPTAGIQWPNSKTRGRKGFLRKVQATAALIHSVPVIAVDPALGREDSRAAVVVFFQGNIIAEFTLGARGAVSTEAALAALYTQVVAVMYEVRAKTSGGIVLVIEELRGGMVNPHLHWAAGTLVAGITNTVRVLRLFELPICYWKAHAAQDPTYTAKTDLADAAQIGHTLYALARHLTGTDHQPRTKRAGPKRKHRRGRPLGSG